MILSDGEIFEAVGAGDLSIEPNRGLDCLQPASVDLRLGEIEGDDWLLPPGAFRLASTLEVVTLGPSLAGQLSGRSSWGRRGLQVHATAGWIDPGFSGQITLELANLSNLALTLAPGMSICQLILFRLGRPAQAPYGTPALRSRYQFQHGPTPARPEVQT